MKPVFFSDNLHMPGNFINFSQFFNLISQKLGLQWTDEFSERVASLSRNGYGKKKEEDEKNKFQLNS